MSGGSALGDSLGAGFVADEGGACDEVEVEGRLAGFGAVVAVADVVATGFGVGGSIGTAAAVMDDVVGGAL